MGPIRDPFHLSPGCVMMYNMRTTARAPKIKRARGNSAVNVGRPIDARTKPAFEAGVQAREDEAKSLADETDLSWLVEGALAYTKKPMNLAPPATKGDIDRLVEEYYGQPKYPQGTPVIFSGVERKQITNPKLGPMRIIRHVWIAPDGSKFSVALDLLQKDQM